MITLEMAERIPGIFPSSLISTEDTKAIKNLSSSANPE